MALSPSAPGIRFQQLSSDVTFMEQKLFQAVFFIMDTRKTALEKAFEIARSGRCLHFPEIIQKLKGENYEVSQIVGPALKKQLCQIIQEAKQSS